MPQTKHRRKQRTSSMDESCVVVFGMKTDGAIKGRNVFNASVPDRNAFKPELQTVFDSLHAPSGWNHCKEVRVAMEQQFGYFCAQVGKSAKPDHVTLFFPTHIRQKNDKFLNRDGSGLNKHLPKPIPKSKLAELKCEVYAPQLCKLRDRCYFVRLHFYPEGKGFMKWHLDSGNDNSASVMKGSYMEIGVGVGCYR